VTSRGIAGGHKQRYRIIDFKRRKWDMEGTVERLEYDPNRTAFIALVTYPDGEKTYIIAPQRLAPGDQVIAAEVVQEGAAILTVTERGYGKQTPLEEYRLTARGGKGIFDIKTGGRNGLVVGMTQVREGDEILLVTDAGQLIRCPVSGIRIAARNTQGVIVFRTAQDEHVVSVERLEASGDGEDDGAEDAAGE